MEYDFSKTLSQTTTSDLLKMENAGGILSDSLIIPDGFSQETPIEVWYSSMPLVDRGLIDVWVQLYRAKVAFSNWVHSKSTTPP